MASSIPDAASYNYEEYDEYLLIQEAAPAPCTSTKEIIPEQIFEPHAQGVEKSMQKTLGGSQDSGYEGKLRSPEMKPAKTAVAEDDKEEEWCVIEEEQERPQGLYGYRDVDYDDQEAEGNIHITDEDL